MSSKINKENLPRKFSSISSLNEVSKAEWDACAGDENPFLCHDFLSSLEDSGSVSPEAGWLSQHIICRNKEKENRLYLCNKVRKIMHLLAKFSELEV